MLNAFTLRGLLTLDAVTCAGMGALLVAAAEPLARLTSLPQPFLLWAGVALLPIAAFMALAAARPAPPLLAVRLIVLGNAAWVAASFAVLAGGLVAPNALGTVLVLGQAAVVALLAWLERAATRTPAAA